MKSNYDSEQNPGIDTPLEYDDEMQSADRTTIIPPEKVDDIEKQARFYDRMDKHIYKHHGFQLLIGCGLIYFLIVIADTVFSNLFNWKTSELTTGFVELVKFVISTLIGYVFSETQKHKNE